MLKIQNKKKLEQSFKSKKPRESGKLLNIGDLFFKEKSKSLLRDLEKNKTPSSNKIQTIVKPDKNESNLSRIEVEKLSNMKKYCSNIDYNQIKSINSLQNTLNQNTVESNPIKNIKTLTNFQKAQIQVCI